MTPTTTTFSVSSRQNNFVSCDAVEAMAFKLLRNAFPDHASERRDSRIPIERSKKNQRRSEPDLDFEPVRGRFDERACLTAQKRAAEMNVAAEEAAIAPSQHEKRKCKKQLSA